MVWQVTLLGHANEWRLHELRTCMGDALHSFRPACLNMTYLSCGSVATTQYLGERFELCDLLLSLCKTLTLTAGGNA